MQTSSLRILQVNTTDAGGGAPKVVDNLHRQFQHRGHRSWLAVGYRQTDEPHVLEIDHEVYRSAWARFMQGVGRGLDPLVGWLAGADRLQRWVRMGLGQPRRWWKIQQGWEDVDFPGTWHLLSLPPEPPDILQVHNMHGDYFDLRALPWLSRRVPVVLTLHDAWALSGHCAHSFACERWKTGCGQCPALDIYPAIRRDASAENWERKRSIFGQSRLYVITPSRWLMEKVEASILAPGIVEARVIPNGIDPEIFFPARDRQAARVSLGLPPEAHIFLVAANGIRGSLWRDFQMMRAAVARLAETLEEEMLFLALGEDAPPEHIGRATVQFVPFQHDASIVARYYQAADVYVHAARADTFPNVVLEALACGTPVVATAVGGIPEQIRSLPGYGAQRAWPQQQATGILVTPGDGEAFAEAMGLLLTDEERRRRLAENAWRDVRQRFLLEQQVDAYLAWYEAILERSAQEGSISRAA